MHAVRGFRLTRRGSEIEYKYRYIAGDPVLIREDTIGYMSKTSVVSRQSIDSWVTSLFQNLELPFEILNPNYLKFKIERALYEYCAKECGQVPVLANDLIL